MFDPETDYRVIARAQKARIAELEAALRRARDQIADQQAMSDPPTWIDEVLAETGKQIGTERLTWPQQP